MILILIILVISLGSCSGFGEILEDDLSLTAVPSKHNQVLHATRNPSLRFNMSMDHSSVQEAVVVHGEHGRVAGQLMYAEGRYEFEADEHWVEGRRYELLVGPELLDARGRRHSIDYRRAFSFERAPGHAFRVTGVLPFPLDRIGPEGRITLQFSDAVDRAQFAASFSLSPGLSFEYDWNESNDSVVIFAPSGFRRDTRYTLQLEPTLQSVGGARLQESFRHDFLVADKAERPVVERLYPALDQVLLDYPRLALDLSELSPGELIAVEWNTAMDSSTVESALTIEPSVSLEFLWPRPDRLLIRPRTTLATDSEYLLQLAGTARSADGRFALQPLEQRFRTRAERQFIREWSNSYGAIIHISEPELEAEHLLRHELLDHHTELSVSIVLNMPIFDQSEREKLVAAARFVPLLPQSAARPVLVSVHWNGAQRVSFRYRNIDGGSYDHPYYYLWQLSQGWGNENYPGAEFRAQMELHR